LKGEVMNKWHNKMKLRREIKKDEFAIKCTRKHIKRAKIKRYCSSNENFQEQMREEINLCATEIAQDKRLRRYRHLAYAYLAGRKYNQLEQKCHEEVCPYALMYYLETGKIAYYYNHTSGHLGNNFIHHNNQTIKHWCISMERIGKLLEIIEWLGQDTNEVLKKR